MKIIRLNAKIQGTKKSIRLDEDEIFQTIIPTWIPNKQQGLYSLGDYISNMMEAAPVRTGDWIKSLSLEYTNVPDGTDLTTDDNIQIYGADANENVEWIFEADLVEIIIRKIIENETLFQSDLYELAEQITLGKDVFGWSNVDPGDLLPEIASKLAIMGFGGPDDSDDETSRNDY